MHTWIYSFQAYFSPKVVKLLSLIINDDEPLYRRRIHNHRRAIISAAKIASSTRKDDAQPAYSRRAIDPLMGSRLYQIPVPSDLPVPTYGSLLEHLADQGILAIGLLRGVSIDDQEEDLFGNDMPYVVTNPDFRAVVTAVDRVFCLAQFDPLAHEGADFEVVQQLLTHLFVVIMKNLLYPSFVFGRPGSLRNNDYGRSPSIAIVARVRRTAGQLVRLGREQ